jgi:two-component system sensor histidine kinase KdpD
MGYLWAAAVVTACTAIGAGLLSHVAPTNLVMIYLLGVMAVALWLGRGPSILAAILSVGAFDFCFVPPRWTFAVGDTEYILTFVVMLITGLVISTLAARLQFQAQSARQRERRTASLYAISRELAATQSRQQIAQIAVRHVMASSDVRAALLLPNKDRRLASTGPEHGGFALSVHDEAVAKWVFEHGQIAGRGTATLPGSEGVYLPLSTSGGTLGVLGILTATGAQSVDIEQLHLFEAFAGLIALAVERTNLETETAQVRLDIETERLRNALLSAVSHDLRTPLSVVTGASSTLLENDQSLDPKTRRELTTSILEESQRLNRLVANLLDMTRLQAGAIKIEKQWQPVEEVIGATLARLTWQLKDHPVTTEIAADLPFVSMDDLLIQQVMFNLLENVVRHTPAGTPIDIAAHQAGPAMVVEVSDRGPGLPPGDPNRLFEKFYQAGGSEQHMGTGLGLAICRGIIELHGGKIYAENRPEGGARFWFSLPLEGKPPSIALQDPVPPTSDALHTEAQP